MSFAALYLTLFIYAPLLSLTSQVLVAASCQGRGEQPVKWSRNEIHTRTHEESLQSADFKIGLVSTHGLTLCCSAREAI